MIQQPAVPASTVPVTNNSGQTAFVTVIGGTVTSINVSGSQVSAGSNFMATVPAGATLAVTYSVVPAWYWSPFTPAMPASLAVVPNLTGQNITIVLASGTVTHVAVAGTDRATSSPANVMLPSGDSVVLTYSVAPVWAWMNFYNPDVQDSLGGTYGDPNLVAATGVSGYSPLNDGPYAWHQAGNMPGFAAGVSN